MQLNLLTSSSNTGLQIISDFPYLFDLAKCSKCQQFILLRSTNKLYGANEDCCCIHEIDVPFLVNTDLAFRLDTVDKEIFDSYQNYFIPDKFNWVILPEYYWDMYVGGDIVAEYMSDKDQYILIDKTTMQPIQQIQMFKYRRSSDFMRVTFMEQLSGLLNRQCTLGMPESFYNLENDESIRKVFDSKAAMGRVLCRFKNDRVDVMMYLYKGLFSLAKADTLEMDVRFDRYESATFMATFKPKKKKNPLKFNTYGIPFQERIHCMFINIS